MLMGLFRDKPHFTPKDSTLLMLKTLPSLHIDKESTDGKYLLRTVESFMNAKDHPSRNQALILAFKQLITREDLPPERRPQPMPSETAVLHEDHIPYPEVIYVTPHTMQTAAYHDSQRPLGNMLILDLLIQEDSHGPRRKKVPTKARYVLTNRITTNGQTVNYPYSITSEPGDPFLCVTRIERFIVVGTGTPDGENNLAYRIVPPKT